VGILSDSEIASMVDTVNQLANANLLEIAKPGSLAPNGDPGTPVAVWKGEVQCSLERAQHERNVGEREEQDKQTTLKVFDAAGAPSTELAGAVTNASTVVVEDLTGSEPVTSRWTVKGTERMADGTLDNILLTLDGETTP
jgi:hypothetical protein